MQVRPQTKGFPTCKSILIVVLLQCFSQAATVEVTRAQLTPQITQGGQHGRDVVDLECSA